VIYNIRIDPEMPTGVHVKLLGWIKSAVAFVRIPASPREAEPRPEPPHAIDTRVAPEEVGTADIKTDHIDTDQIKTDDINTDHLENRPESRINVASESRISIETEPRTSVEPESETVVDSESAPNQQEIDRRRGIVREFFNDYWASADDKPTSFAERLDRAEGYINERVAAGGEAWRLGPATRKQLGLPASRKR
jgi:hypothetical protein